MSKRTAEVVPFPRKTPFWNDTFTPPDLPPLYEMRKCHGLSLEEAASILHVASKTLEIDEALSYPGIFNDLDSVMCRYQFFLGIHGENRERNIIRHRVRCYTLREIRYRIFRQNYGVMGYLYGKYTARQWYHFEMHDEILPREILNNIKTDLRSFGFVD